MKTVRAIKVVTNVVYAGIVTGCIFVDKKAEINGYCPSGNHRQSHGYNCSADHVCNTGRTALGLSLSQKGGNREIYLVRRGEIEMAPGTKLMWYVLLPGGQV